MVDERKNLILGLTLALMIVFSAFHSAYASNNTAFTSQNASGELLWGLISASDAAYTNLSKIEMALENASIALKETGLDGPDARVVLSDLIKTDSAVIDCITIDTNGTVREVAPDSYENVKGDNLKWQAQVNDTLNTGQYSGFHFINAVEGVYAIDSEMPIFDSNGTLVGTVSTIFNNSQFFDRVLAPYQNGEESKIWVIKADDGTILYETDPSQIMLNKSSSVFLDYPEILMLYDRMSAERMGYGTYEFLDQVNGETIKKGCYWVTIPNKGTEMRLVLTIKLD